MLRRRSVRRPSMVLLGHIFNTFQVRIKSAAYIMCLHTSNSLGVRSVVSPSVDALRPSLMSCFVLLTGDASHFEVIFTDSADLLPYSDSNVDHGALDLAAIASAFLKSVHMILVVSGNAYRVQGMLENLCDGLELGPWCRLNFAF